MIKIFGGRKGSENLYNEVAIETYRIRLFSRRYFPHCQS